MHRLTGHLSEILKRICNVQHMSKQPVLSGLLWLHFNTLTAVHMSSLGNLRESSWKHFYITWASEISSGQSTSLSNCFMKCRVHVKLSYCCFSYCIFFPKYKPDVYLSFTLRWRGVHATSARQPGNTDSCPSCACKTHPLHSPSPSNTAVMPVPCARSYSA